MFSRCTSMLSLISLLSVVGLFAVVVQAAADDKTKLGNDTIDRVSALLLSLDVAMVSGNRRSATR